jgi:hypothetical protein
MGTNTTGSISKNCTVFRKILLGSGTKSNKTVTSLKAFSRENPKLYLTGFAIATKQQDPNTKKPQLKTNP